MRLEEKTSSLFGKCNWSQSNKQVVENDRESEFMNNCDFWSQEHVIVGALGTGNIKGRGEVLGIWNCVHFCISWLFVSLVSYSRLCFLWKYMESSWWISWHIRTHRGTSGNLECTSAFLVVFFWRCRRDLTLLTRVSNDVIIGWTNSLGQRKCTGMGWTCGAVPVRPAWCVLAFALELPASGCRGCLCKLLVIPKITDVLL